MAFLVDAQEVGDLFDRAAGTGERLDVFGIDLGLGLSGASLSVVSCLVIRLITAQSTHAVVRTLQ